MTLLSIKKGADHLSDNGYAMAVRIQLAGSFQTNLWKATHPHSNQTKIVETSSKELNFTHVAVCCPYPARCLWWSTCCNPPTVCMWGRRVARCLESRSGCRSNLRKGLPEDRYLLTYIISRLTVAKKQTHLPRVLFRFILAATVPSQEASLAGTAELVTWRKV